MSSSSGVATAVEDGGGLNGRGVPARERERERERRIDVWRGWWNGNLEKTRRERERERERGLAMAGQSAGEIGK